MTCPSPSTEVVADPYEGVSDEAVSDPYEVVSAGALSAEMEHLSLSLSETLSLCRSLPNKGLIQWNRQQNSNACLMKR